MNPGTSGLQARAVSGYLTPRESIWARRCARNSQQLCVGRWLSQPLCHRGDVRISDRNQGEWHPHVLSLAMFALLLFQALIAVDKPETAGMASAPLKETTAAIESSIRSGEIRAASVLVARHGKIVLHRGFGKISASANASPVQADSVFLLASITKPVTACALMLLVERGKVSLSDPVLRYLPAFTGGDRARCSSATFCRTPPDCPTCYPTTRSFGARTRRSASLSSGRTRRRCCIHRALRSATKAWECFWPGP